MRARSPRRPLYERGACLRLGRNGKHLKHNELDMTQLRRGCLHNTIISRRSGYLAAGMRLHHSHVPALPQRFLAALPFCWRHRSIRRHAGHYWECGEEYRQSENTDSTHKCQHSHSSCYCELDATGGPRFQITQVTQDDKRTITKIRSDDNILPSHPKLFARSPFVITLDKALPGMSFLSTFPFSTEACLLMESRHR
jgi:hypothetical protein